MTRTLVALWGLLFACTRADETRQPPPTPPPLAPAFAPRPTTPPPPPPAPAPAPALHGRRHGVPRTQLGTSDTLPTHGIVVHTYGIGGESIITIDRDAKTLHSWSTSMGEPKPRDRTRTLTGDALARLVEVADAAWAEDPTGPMSQATDIREDLYVVDGDDGFYLSGYPIHAFGAPTGRPAASRAIEAIYSAARCACQRPTINSVPRRATRRHDALDRRARRRLHPGLQSQRPRRRDGRVRRGRRVPPPSTSG